MVIAAMGKDLHPNGLAILGTGEVENRAVVEDLIATKALKDADTRSSMRNHAIVAGSMLRSSTTRPSTASFAHKSYRVYMADTSFRTRDQLLVSGVLDGDTTHVIVCHWPSRRGGEKRSANQTGKRLQN